MLCIGMPKLSAKGCYVTKRRLSLMPLRAEAIAKYLICFFSLRVWSMDILIDAPKQECGF